MTGQGILQKLKHNYNDVYYSDLDNQTEELNDLEQFLKKNIDINKIALVNVDPKSEEVLIKPYEGDRSSLIEYVFIRSDLAGVGNYNFILEFKE